ncbi:hypothetical protein FTO70_05130 [Methanosarcina sp. KYL-1]|uniref:hypothetical protein n=1 Tax=Methanosarcina sp. KYL-1 TaxID=2602068 RepID=UPI002101C132|nr:hypothetical protein [Methanosarcina sp. KYL-1]MCQ1535080.1 hypothetical protein [Methanosarcina sp. KYL-1]
MKKDIGTHYRQNKLPGFAATLLGLFLALMIVSPALAVPAAEWEVSPSSPYVGDTLVITGTTDPNVGLRADVSFEKTASVSDGAYSYRLAEVKIPSGEENCFTVEAEPVQSLQVAVKKLIWITLNGNVNEGVGTVSHSNVPPLTYEVKIYGNAQEGESSVNLTITASQTITADSEGNFRYEYDTDSMPAGDYEISIGGDSKTITLRERSSSSGGGSGTGSATIRPAEPEEEAPEVTENESEEEGDEDGSSGAITITPDQGADEAENTGSETQDKTPEEEEPALNGSFMVFGIIASLLVISLFRKSRK